LQNIASKDKKGLMTIKQIEERYKNGFNNILSANNISADGRMREPRNGVGLIGTRDWYQPVNTSYGMKEENSMFSPHKNSSHTLNGD
jgi:hypothetical protein